VTYKELHYFTGKCLNIDSLPSFRDSLAARSSATPPGWEELIWFWDQSLILCTVYCLFRKNGLLNLFPGELAAHLGEIHRLNRLRNERILSQESRITGALNKAAIYPVYLKGLGNLMDGLYNDPGERIIGDIDLLVPEADFLKAVATLVDLGYQSSVRIYDDPEKEMHYPPLYHPEEPANVEIHRIPVASAYTGSFSAAVLLAEKKTVTGRTGCLVPSDRHKVIHTFLHSEVMNHGHAFRHLSFRALYDLLLLSQRTRVADLPPLTGYPGKTKDWLALAGKLMDCPGKFFPDGQNPSRKYEYWFDLSLEFPRLNEFLVLLVKAFHLVFVRYLYLMAKALFSKTTRKAIAGRLSDRTWYSSHLRSLKRYFYFN